MTTQAGDSLSSITMDKTTRKDLVDLSSVQALCFDVDGTLCDTDDQMVVRLSSWLHQVDFLLNKGDSKAAARRIVMAMENPGTYFFGLLDHFHIDHHIARMSDGIARLKRSNKSREPLPIIPGVKEMLVRLQPHYPMALVSARGRRNTLAFLDHYQLTPFFKAIATGQTCLYTKPYPDPILWVASQMNVLPSECLMIGDTTVDIRAGKAAGSKTVGVLCGFGEEEELKLAGADLILPKTPDLVRILLE
jgi:HAD superfamily hydrolase (TIGR01549 family)